VAADRELAADEREVGGGERDVLGQLVGRRQEHRAGVPEHGVAGERRPELLERREAARVGDLDHRDENARARADDAAADPAQERVDLLHRRVLAERELELGARDAVGDLGV
jgi:hypothetical protein